MNKEELDKLWKESGEKQERMMDEVRSKKSDEDHQLDSPMVRRMLDGSDIL